jgi:hypothetical protein
MFRVLEILHVLDVRDVVKTRAQALEGRTYALLVAGFRIIALVPRQYSPDQGARNPYDDGRNQDG